MFWLKSNTVEIILKHSNIMICGKDDGKLIQEYQILYKTLRPWLSIQRIIQNDVMLSLTLKF